MKAAIYARVSTDKQGRDQTVDSQLEALRRWATAHGHELKDDHVYIDEGYSGARLDRPALDRLRDAVREGEFDVLGVYSPDRLARRYAYQVLLLGRCCTNGVGGRTGRSFLVGSGDHTATRSLRGIPW
jgi:site-specific DNA recombinase